VFNFRSLPLLLDAFPSLSFHSLIVFLVPLQMAYSMLSEIHKESNQWTICVLVSRMWHYHGGTDEGLIKHTDLVLLDSKVSAAAALTFVGIQSVGV
jgi:hypothetical protein